jgi:hypothetical protein
MAVTAAIFSCGVYVRLLVRGARPAAFLPVLGFGCFFAAEYPAIIRYSSPLAPLRRLPLLPVCDALLNDLPCQPNGGIGCALCGNAGLGAGLGKSRLTFSGFSFSFTVITSLHNKSILSIILFSHLVKYPKNFYGIFTSYPIDKIR